MAEKRKVEVFTAGCPMCDDTIELVKRIACASCEVTVVDVRDTAMARRAKTLGVRSVPAVAVDGTLADCCRSGPTEADLRRAGVGQPA